MRILTAPSWSFGRDSDLLFRFRDLLEEMPVEIHYLRSDVDLNRTHTVFSGKVDHVFTAVERMCELAFDRIDLNHHVGAHTRTGALDLCPFVAFSEPAAPSSKLQLLKPTASEESMDDLEAEQSSKSVKVQDVLLREVEGFAARLAGLFELPVFLYEKSERGRHEADLPYLRRCGFGGLLEREINPDFGPSHIHPRLGVSLVGMRDFVLSVNVNFFGAEPLFVKGLTADVRGMRASGDHRFLGVVARPFALPSIGQSQLSLSFTLPTLTSADLALEWIMAETLSRKRRLAGVELAGAIRRRDLPKATRVPVRVEQIVDL